MSDYKKVMCPKCKEIEGLQLSTGDIYCFQCDETKSIFIFQDLDGESLMAFVITESFAEAVELIKVEYPDMEYIFEGWADGESYQQRALVHITDHLPWDLPAVLI